MQYTYKRAVAFPEIPSSTPLPTLLPHLQHTLDSGLEALLEPVPPPLAVQTLPLETGSLVEPLLVEVLLDLVLGHLDLHRPESSRNIHASRVVHVDCSSKSRAKLHGCWLGRWRWCIACASWVEHASDLGSRSAAEAACLSGFHEFRQQVVGAAPGLLFFCKLGASGRAGGLCVVGGEARSACRRGGRGALLHVECSVEESGDVLGCGCGLLLALGF